MFNGGLKVRAEYCPSIEDKINALQIKTQVTNYFVENLRAGIGGGLCEWLFQLPCRDVLFKSFAICGTFGKC